MEEKQIGIIKLTADGLRDLATAIDNIYFKKNCIISMPIWQGNDGLYMQLTKGSGFITLVKDKTELKEVKADSSQR